MRNSFSILLCTVFLISCGNDSTTQPKLVSIKIETSGAACGPSISTLELSIDPKFRPIKLDLYADSLGNIYHRTIDLSTLEGDGYYSYLPYARLYNNVDDDYQIMELKSILDTVSFQKSKKIDPNGRTTYFEDVNYTYYLYSMAEGGVLGARHK